MNKEINGKKVEDQKIRLFSQVKGPTRGKVLQKYWGLTWAPTIKVRV